MSMHRVARGIFGGIAALAVAVAALKCSNGAEPSSPELQLHAKTASALTYTCTCPATTNPQTGAVARIFAGGGPATDALLLEDAVTQDVYRWSSGTSWHRIGSSARTYALNASGLAFRLSGDGRAEQGANDNLSDIWTRVGTETAQRLIASGGSIFAVGDVGPSTTVIRKFLSTFLWSVIDSPTTAFVVGGESGIYRSGSTGGTGSFVLSGGAWTQIGADSPVAMYVAAGTVFAQSSLGSVARYRGTPFQWDDVGTGIDKIAGTSTAAFSLKQGAIAKLDLATNTWSPVPGATDARDIVAGGAHLFKITSAGSVLELDDTGAWLPPLSCAGAISDAGCVNGCDPGPAPSRVAPAYADPQKNTQETLAYTVHDVLTHHNDNARTGAASHEDILTRNAVKTGAFGLLGSPVPIPGKIYAQPLYVERAAVVCNADPSHGIPAGLQNRDIAYVATLENTIYAVDIDRQGICWATKPLGCPQPVNAAGCSGDGRGDVACNDRFNLNKEPQVNVGIVSTPVIDRVKDVMYVVARVRDGNDTRGRFFVNVIDTRTGQLVSKVEAIADAMNGRNDCGGHALRPSVMVNRAALLLVNDRLFLGFASIVSEDSTVTDYHGSVLGFDVSDPTQPRNLANSFCATPAGAGGGIWMASSGPASDGTSVYFTTGNGAYPTSRGSYILGTIPEFPVTGNYPDSFVKVGTDLSTGSTLGYTDVRTTSQIDIVGSPYVPQLQFENKGDIDPGPAGHTLFWGRERSDADFGSGGVLLLGNSVVGGGKDGRMYVVDKSTMLRVQDFQAFVHNADSQATYNFHTDYQNGPHIHGGPVAWDARTLSQPYIYVYAWSEKDHLKRFRFDPTVFKFMPTDAVDATPPTPLPTAHGDIASANNSMPGGMLSVSSNGSQDGIVWAVVEEPYKFCTLPSGGQGKILTDRPELSAVYPPDSGTASPKTEIVGCNVIGGYVPGRLFAFSGDSDTSNRLSTLWGDRNVPNPNNLIPSYSKFAPPTVAHGRILVPTANGELRIYGLGSPQQSQKPAGELACDDILLTGVNGWSGIPLAASNGDGKFTVTRDTQAAFAAYAGTTGAIAWGADFSGDGKTDVVLGGPSSWTFIPMLRSLGDGTFAYTRLDSPWWASVASVASTTKIIADFDGDEKSDIALIGEPSWSTVPMARSNGDGSFRITNSQPVFNGTNFATWASSTGVTRLGGDFNGDGKADIALIGASYFTTIPVAYSTGDSNGSFVVTNTPSPSSVAFGCVPNPNPNLNLPLCYNEADFEGWVRSAGATSLIGDFNGDGRADIALTGVSTWTTIPVAFSSAVTLPSPLSGEGAFRVSNRPLPTDGDRNFAAWAAGAMQLVGDFNGDGRADIALTNVVGVSNVAVPVAFSNGDGSFRVTMTTPAQSSFGAENYFAGLAAGQNVKKIVGDFDHDGSADIALAGGAGWTSVPVALSNGDGTFRIVNDTTGMTNFAGWASTGGATKLRGNYR
jgi:hypothetical protein